MVEVSGWCIWEQSKVTVGISVRGGLVIRSISKSDEGEVDEVVFGVEWVVCWGRTGVNAGVHMGGIVWRGVGSEERGGVIPVLWCGDWEAVCCDAGAVSRGLWCSRRGQEGGGGVVQKMLDRKSVV